MLAVEGGRHPALDHSIPGPEVAIFSALAVGVSMPRGKGLRKHTQVGFWATVMACRQQSEKAAQPLYIAKAREWENPGLPRPEEATVFKSKLPAPSQVLSCVLGEEARLSHETMP
jgi:hypothetical protein